PRPPPGRASPPWTPRRGAGGFAGSPLLGAGGGGRVGVGVSGRGGLGVLGRGSGRTCLPGGANRGGRSRRAPC
ncbi:TPM domain-containing protein, partial [Amycolatopsis acidiphila]